MVIRKRAQHESPLKPHENNNNKIDDEAFFIILGILYRCPPIMGQIKHILSWPKSWVLAAHLANLSHAPGPTVSCSKKSRFELKICTSNSDSLVFDPQFMSSHQAMTLMIEFFKGFRTAPDDALLSWPIELNHCCSTWKPFQLRPRKFPRNDTNPQRCQLARRTLTLFLNLMENFRPQL